MAEYNLGLANALGQSRSVGVILRHENVVKTLGLDPGSYLSGSVSVTVVHHLQRRRPLRALQSVAQVLSVLARLRPSVIHIQDTYDPMATLLLPVLARWPLVVTVHDPVRHPGTEEEHTWRYLAASQALRRRADRLIVHGTSSAKRLQAEMPELRAPVHVTPHGALDVFRRWTDPDRRDDGRTVLFFGRVYAYRGLEYLVRAAPLVAAAIPDVRFVIAGAGPDLARCEQLMTDHNRFEVRRGFIPNPQVTALYQQAAVVALPHVEASQSGVLSIALALGKPVVASAVGDLPDAVRDGVTGYLVPPRDPAALADALIRLLRDPTRREQMGQAALALADDELSWPRVAQATLEVYNAAIQDGAARTRLRRATNEKEHCPWR